MTYKAYPCGKYEWCVSQVDVPLERVDIDLLAPFAGEYHGTPLHIYTPFDPNNWKIPADTSKFVGKRVGDTYAWFSPNIYRLFMEQYVKEDKEGNKYFYEFPILFVDYNTPLGFIYSGPEKPPDRPIEKQIEDWKNGYMWSRRELYEDKKMMLCVPVEGNIVTCMPHEYRLKKGWYWVKYQARLISAPATLITGVSDVLVFAYKKPSSFIWKVPGFRSIADYLIKRKLNREGIEKINEMLAPFGYSVDYDQEYITKSGHTVRGPAVEETHDEYLVYVPVRKRGSLGPEIGIGVVIAVVAIATAFIVGAAAIMYIQSLKHEAYKLYLAAAVEAQNNYTRCVSACNAYQDKTEREKCLSGCRNAYQSTVNMAQRAWEEYNKGSTLGEVKDILKWGVIALVVVNLARGLGSGSPVIIEKVREVGSKVRR